jgi:hypothetical protein
VEEFEVDARAAVATQAERDKEVLQKLLTVKDQMIWCAPAGAPACISRSRVTDTAHCRSLIEERDALRERLGDGGAQ